MTAKWNRFTVHLTLKETWRTHLEEIYLSEDVRDELMSYEPLKRLGHVDHKTFTQPIEQPGMKQKNMPEHMY